MTEISKLVKGSREAQNLTQEELANYMGVTKQFISNIERGVCLIPKDKIHFFCTKLNISRYKATQALSKDWLSKFKEK